MATIVGNTLTKIYPKDLVNARYEQNDASALFPVGSASYDNYGGLWNYVSFSAVVAIYDAVWIDETYAALTILNATTPAAARPVSVGIAQIAAPSTASYGWVWRGGGGGTTYGIKVNVLISCVKDVPLYATATAGKLDDAPTTQYKVSSLGITATEPGTATAAIECYASIPMNLVQVST